MDVCRYVCVYIHIYIYIYIYIAQLSLSAPHCDASAALGSMAAAASRRRGVATPEVLARRAKALVGIQLWRRAAAMVNACIPVVPARDAEDLIPAERDRRRAELGIGPGDEVILPTLTIILMPANRRPASLVASDTN